MRSANARRFPLSRCVQTLQSIIIGGVIRNRANMAHGRQSRPESGLCFQVKVLKTFQVVPSSLGRVFSCVMMQTSAPCAIIPICLNFCLRLSAWQIWRCVLVCIWALMAGWRGDDGSVDETGLMAVVRCRVYTEHFECLRPESGLSFRYIFQKTT